MWKMPTDEERRAYVIRRIETKRRLIATAKERNISARTVAEHRRELRDLEETLAHLPSTDKPHHCPICGHTC